MRPELGIQNIAVGLPQACLSPGELGFGQSESYYSHVSGAESLYRSNATEGAFELCLRAAENLLYSHPETFSDLDAILVVTLPTEPTVAPISARLQPKLKAANSVFCLDLTLSCVGFLQASSLLVDMMEMRRWKKAILFNVETLSKILNEDDKALQLVMSDSATACLFSDKPKMQYENFDFGVEGDLASILGTRNQKMYMDGPRVYETVLRKIPVSIQSAMDRFGIEKDQVDYFAFHQGSRKVLDKLAERLELGPARILGNLKKMGNTGSCSIPHLLYDLQKEHHATEKLIFCTAFGAGFQWAHSSVRLRKNG
ncbi:MAG: 3-oxoacyl-ACP synthase III family protein [Bdellovibrionota bacterium]